jgi:predicted regulator of Ras-like GTPase activity (Roadblock/LC7/MglB family)
MLSIFKKIFGKPEPKAAVVLTPRAVPAPVSTPMPTIEVAHLSLAAIVARFPEELKPLLIGEADPAATVALPLPTILKQLPTGSVKMSLASLHRQAHGLIKPLPPGDKRTIEVPLAEIFRHVRPEAFRRRADQRHLEVPENGFNLFGDSSHPYSIAPDDEPSAPEGTPEPEPLVLDLTPEMPRVLKMDDGLRAHFDNGAPAEPEAAVETPEPAPRVIAPSAQLQPPKSSAVAPVTAAPASTASAPTKASGSTLALPLAALAGNWPDEIRAEIAGFDPAATVALPVNEVTAGLAKGRVMFAWKQIHSWIEPACASPSAVAGETMLQMPLKVVAPAFLSSSKKPAAERKAVNLDESIPALFSDGRPPAEVPAEPAVEAAVEATPTASAEPEHVPDHPPEHAPEQVPETAPAAQKLPETVGEIFGQPQKQHWTPAELVKGTVTLPGVAGAIVALQEGLSVSASLPDGVKSDVVAAFLPQIFARLNQYAGEMRLGDVDDLLFTTHGAHCQIYRLGYVYFAVLGQAGESLPWHELRLITEELARQTHK